MTSSNTVWHHAVIKREHRQRQNGHKSAVLWFRGLAGAGKSTLAHAVEEKLYALGCRTYVLDGDNVRHGLCGDLGADRERVREEPVVSELVVDTSILTLEKSVEAVLVLRVRVSVTFPWRQYAELTSNTDGC